MLLLSMDTPEGIHIKDLIKAEFNRIWNKNLENAIR